MKWGGLAVLAAILAVGCREKETGAEYAEGRRVTHREDSDSMGVSSSEVTWFDPANKGVDLSGRHFRSLGVAQKVWSCMSNK